MNTQEIDDLKENLERKEYLLQFNEQKYYQYEKVLRDLILNKNTDEAVKDQLREKIESQELFVPKDERKLSNVIKVNNDLNEQISILKLDNQKMQNQLEEILERGQVAKQNIKQILMTEQNDDMDFGQAGSDKQGMLQNNFNFMDQTIEQLSIFQNKELGQFRNIDLENIKKDQKYVKRLELSVDNLNEKLSKLKAQMQKQKTENSSLKASNDNHVYINDKLNSSL